MKPTTDPRTKRKRGKLTDDQVRHLRDQYDLYDATGERQYHWTESAKTLDLCPVAFKDVIAQCIHMRSYRHVV